MDLLDTLKERTGDLPDHRKPSQATTTDHSGRVAVSDAWIETLVLSLQSLPDTAESLKKVGKNVVTDSNRNGFMEIVDGWGRPLIYVVGVSHSDPFTEDDFLPEHKKAFLVSPGPDGRFGDVRDPKDKAWADNVYSFDLE